MSPAGIAGLCLILVGGRPGAPPPEGLNCPPPAVRSIVLDGRRLASQVAVPGARDGIARVAFAEAGDQGDSGLAGVVYTILNRLADGRWGGSVEAVLDAPHQFEPVMRAGGDWRGLPKVDAAAQARVDTILNLALEGRLPDLTRGARYFQNPALMTARARAGLVSPGLVNFGGRTPSTIIGDHAFYAGAAGAGEGGARAKSAPPSEPEPRIFIGAVRAATVIDPPTSADAFSRPRGPPEIPQTSDPRGALFITHDGVAQAGRP